MRSGRFFEVNEMRWWMKLIGGLLAVAVLLWLAIRIGSFTVDILSAGDGGSSEQDPQFAQEAERVTQPPELWQEDGETEFTDNSANWDTSVQTPVEQTAQELGEEARAENSN